MIRFVVAVLPCLNLLVLFTGVAWILDPPQEEDARAEKAKKIWIGFGGYRVGRPIRAVRKLRQHQVPPVSLKMLRSVQ